MPRLPDPLRGLVLGAVLAATAARADPGYYVVTPYDNAGLRIVDLRYWTVKQAGSPEVVWPEAGLGYGVNKRWTTELLMSWIGMGQRAVRPSTLNWQNQVLVTQGEWPLDVALHLQAIVPQGRNTAPRSLEVGPLLQTDIGRTQLNANVVFERFAGAGPKPPTQLKLQWQLRHRFGPVWHAGLQGFDELGAWDDWAPHAKQSHRAGPAVFGTWHADGGATYKLQSAWLLGRIYGRSGHMFTLRVHTEF